jgi:hypothetical protein
VLLSNEHGRISSPNNKLINDDFPEPVSPKKIEKKGCNRIFNLGI